MSIRYTYKLTQNERQTLEEYTLGVRPSRQVLLARALLLLDSGKHNHRHWKTTDVAEMIGVTTRTLEHLKKRMVQGGIDEALERKNPEKPCRPVKFDGEFEARLTQLACSDPPEGRARWTVRLLAEKLVELKITDSVSPMTISRALKKTNLNLTEPNIGESPQSTVPNL